MRQHGGALPYFEGSPYQSGGAIPYFSGAPMQYGGGFGDIMRGFFRNIILPFFAPIAGSAASSFIKNTAQGINEGKSFLDSAKSSLKPTLGAAIDTTAEVIKKQVGSGRSRKRVYKLNTPKHIKKVKRQRLLSGNF